MRENLLAGQAVTPHFADGQRFAADLGATFLDGSHIFAGMSRKEIRAHFLPYDGHWNQKGSDRFAEFIVQNLGILGISRDGTAGSNKPITAEGPANAALSRRSAMSRTHLVPASVARQLSLPLWSCANE
jgi:hypothetical protein